MYLLAEDRRGANFDADCAGLICQTQSPPRKAVLSSAATTAPARHSEMGPLDEAISDDS
jgi:hypothetical protein